MNGYAVTETAEEALAAYERPGVRHAAALDTGEGFLAFDGPIPVDHGTIFENVEVDGWWWFSVRRIAPASQDEVEHFALFSADAFRRLSPAGIRMASLVKPDMVLTLSESWRPGAVWQATAESFRDHRLDDVTIGAVLAIGDDLISAGG